MSLSMTDIVLWSASLVLHCALLAVLFLRSRVRKYPVFASLIGFELLQTTVLFIFSHRYSAWAYFYAYWCCAFIDYVFQVFLVFEIARDVLRVNDTWLPEMRTVFVRWAVGGTLLSLFLCLTLQSHGSSRIDLWQMRVNLFTSILTGELFLSLCFAINRLGLPWNTQGMRLGQGLTVWIVAANFGDIVYAATATRSNLVIIDHLRMSVYLGLLLFWIAVFSFPKREFGLPPAHQVDELSKRLKESRYNHR